MVLNDEAPQAEQIGAGSVAVFSRNKAKVIVKERESSWGGSHSGEACERRSEGGPDVHPVGPRLGCERAAAAGIQVGGNEDPREPRARLRAFEIKPTGEAQIDPARATPTRKASFSQRRVLAAVGPGQSRSRDRGG